MGGLNHYAQQVRMLVIPSLIVTIHTNDFAFPKHNHKVHGRSLHQIPNFRRFAMVLCGIRYRRQAAFFDISPCMTASKALRIASLP